MVIVLVDVYLLIHLLTCVIIFAIVVSNMFALLKMIITITLT